MTKITLDDKTYYYQIKTANPRSVRFRTIFHNQQFSEANMLQIDIYDINKIIIKSTLGFTTTSLLSESIKEPDIHNDFIEDVETYVTSVICKKFNVKPTVRNPNYIDDTKSKPKSTNKRKSKTKSNDKHIENEDLIPD